MRGRTGSLPAVRRAGPLVAMLTFGLLGLPATAQFPDPLSATECPGCAAALAPTPFEGIWSTALTADEPVAALEDFLCFAACTDEGRTHAARLLTDERYAHRSALELYPEAVAANARSVVQQLTPAARAALPSDPARMPALSCDRPSLAVQVVSPLPLEIERGLDRFVLRYEELDVERTVFVDAGAAPTGDRALPFGVSVGRLEHGTLVVETARVPAGRLSAWLGGIPHSDALRTVERYSVDADGRTLELVLELEDPQTFVQPLVVTKRWLRAPGARLASYRCDVMAAGLEGVFAEYLDPRKVDARRRAARRQAPSP